MNIKVTFNSSEIKNPILRFIVTLALSIVFMVLGIIVLFFILPVLWVFLASVMLLVLTLLAAAPKLIGQYKIILLDRQKIENKK